MALLGDSGILSKWTLIGDPLTALVNRDRDVLRITQLPIAGADEHLINTYLFFRRRPAQGGTVAGLHPRRTVRQVRCRQGQTLPIGVLGLNRHAQGASSRY